MQVLAAHMGQQVIHLFTAMNTDGALIRAPPFMNASVRVQVVLAGICLVADVTLVGFHCLQWNYKNSNVRAAYIL